MIGDEENRIFYSLLKNAHSTHGQFLYGMQVVPNRIRMICITIPIFYLHCHTWPAMQKSTVAPPMAGRQDRSSPKKYNCQVSYHSNPASFPEAESPRSAGVVQSFQQRRHLWVQRLVSHISRRSLEGICHLGCCGSGRLRPIHEEIRKKRTPWRSLHEGSIRAQLMASRCAVS